MNIHMVCLVLQITGFYMVLTWYLISILKILRCPIRSFKWPSGIHFLGNSCDTMSYLKLDHIQNFGFQFPKFLPHSYSKWTLVLPIDVQFISRSISLLCSDWSFGAIFILLYLCPYKVVVAPLVCLLFTLNCCLTLTKTYTYSLYTMSFNARLLPPLT